MRQAEIDDAWRRLRKSNAREILSIQLSWGDVPRLSDGNIVLQKPFTLICGENGAGKSTLLHLLHHAFAATDLSRSANVGRFSRPHNGKVRNLSVALLRLANNKRKELKGAALGRHFFPSGEAALVSFIDTGLEVPSQLERIRQETHLADVLSSFGARAFEADERNFASWVVGRTYEQIEVFEVEESSAEDVLPYFRATAHGVTYDSPEMGYGELATLLFIWQISRLPDGGLLLIEEPEAFLAPRSQTALVDVLAYYAFRKKLTVIVTSHSGAVAKRLGLDEIVYVTRGPGAVVLDCPAQMAELVGRLGLLPNRAPLFVVEDVAASIFARVIFDSRSQRLARMGEFVIRNGEGEVRRTIAAVPATIRTVAHIGILDGDQRAKLNAAEPRVVCLPGMRGPDDLIRGMAEGLPAGELADAMHLSFEDVQRALSDAGGSDSHDWCADFGRRLGLHRDEVLKRLTLKWISANEQDVDEFVRSVEVLV